MRAKITILVLSFLLIASAIAYVFLSRKVYEAQFATQSMLQVATSSTLTPVVASTTAVHVETATTTKTYRNDEWGFEFEYPAGWTFHPNTFYSPFSRFNLVGASPEEHGNPDPLTPSILVNVVTPDFAKNVFVDLKNSAEKISVNGILGLKYRYEYEGVSKIAVTFSFVPYVIIFDSYKTKEDVFNQILSSFKFFSTTTPR